MLQLIASPGDQDIPQAEHPLEHFWVLYLYKPPTSCSIFNFYVFMHMGKKDAET